MNGIDYAQMQYTYDAAAQGSSDTG